jgi:hypothetical protein
LYIGWSIYRCRIGVEDDLSARILPQLFKKKETPQFSNKFEVSCD